MKIHELKTDPGPFQAVVIGAKKFEIRKDDRGFEVGDRLLLREFDRDTARYTGREMKFVIGYILNSYNDYGLHPGYVAMTIIEDFR